MRMVKDDRKPHITHTTFDERMRIIKQHPCFTQLNSQEIEKMAGFLTEKTYIPNQDIVIENELVNSIYFLVKGRAEVKHQDTPVATLNPGEAIGLNETGLYSQTGMRTATVTAITDVLALRLDINAFNEIIRESPHISAVLNQQVGTLQRMNLIKHAAPFAELNTEELRWLAEQTVEFNLSQGQTIFQKGDEGDYCYLIQSGKVEIYISQADGADQRIALLKTNKIFGETSLFLNAQRNASARALTESKLVGLSKETLQQVLAKTEDISNALMALTKSRSRPLRFNYIQQFSYVADDGQEVFTLKDPLHNNYFRLAPEGLFLWEQLDGTKTIKDLANEFFNQFEDYDPAMISGFIVDLMDAGFVEPSPFILTETAQLPMWVRIFIFIRRMMEATVSTNHADHWVTRAYQSWGHYFFKPLVLSIFVIISISGLTTFVMTFSQHIALFSALSPGWMIIVAVPTTMAFSVLHELAHAFTTKYFGREVKNFGVGWFWLGPIAFCDTSDMWLNPKNQRIYVDLAGLFLDSVIAGFLSLLVLHLSNIYVVTFIWILTLFYYIGILRNLNPMIELDGYYTLMDWSGVDNLRLTSLHWLMDNYENFFKNPKILFQRKMEVSYWWICLLYLVFSIYFSYFVAKYFLSGFLGTNNVFLKVGILILVVIASSLSLIAQAQRLRHH